MDRHNKARSSAADRAWRHARRIAVLVGGGTLLAVGLALTVLPGPAVVVIPAGLAVLAIEFHWARRWLHKFRSALPNGVRTQPGPPPESREEDPKREEPPAAPSSGKRAA